MAYTSSEIGERWMDPYFKFYVNRKGSIKERINFLMKKGEMRDEYLGACLDYVRWGAMNACGWETGVSGLIKFIEHWMKLNQGRLIWSDEPVPEKIVLPYIDYQKCPRSETHKGTLVDCAGRARCSHIDKDKLKKGFICEPFSSFDEYSQTARLEFWDEQPHDPSWIDEEGDEKCDPTEWQEYLAESEEYEQAEIEEISKPCYAIISEPKKRVLALETVLDRLNIEPRMKAVYCGNGNLPGLDPCRRLNELEDEERRMAETLDHCPGHQQENPWVVMPFCGWTLAWYVQKWHEQVKNGKVPIYRKPGEIDTFRKYKNFQVITSED